MIPIALFSIGAILLAIFSGVGYVWSYITDPLFRYVVNSDIKYSVNDKIDSIVSMNIADVIGAVILGGMLLFIFYHLIKEAMDKRKNKE